ncbi:MFS transporter [Deinococcus sonorensis]|uniref:MFS transporter n=2 Tax=Deinococcus sonorensis TaxID=309891 RepID=A0AAU7U9L5_9DEIO
MVAPTIQPSLPRVSPWALSSFWFGSAFHWLLLLLILMPADIERLVGSAHKGTYLGLLSGLGAVVALVLPPLVGSYSDRVGKRITFIRWGVAANVAGLLVMGFGLRAGFNVYLLGFLLVQFGNNFATAPYSALIPEYVAPAQRGRYSGVMGLLQLSGQLLGGVVGALVGTAVVPRELAFVLVAVVLGLSALVTILRVPEPPRQELPADTAPRLGWLQLFAQNAFFWVFVTRALFSLGQYSVQPFLQYYLHDVIGRFRLFGLNLGNAVTASSVMLLAIIVGGVASTLLAGQLSDRLGRKPVIFFAGSVMAAAAILLLFGPPFGGVLLLALVFGLGFGAFTSVDWALGSDAMPSRRSFGRDMGIWHVAFVAPQLAQTPQGRLLDWGNALQPNLGYTLVFGIAAAFFLLGVVLVQRVKNLK